MNEDPFAELTRTGRTYVKPTPDQRPPIPSATRPTTMPDIEAPCRSGLNPLVALANPLLALVPQLRATTRLAQPVALRDSLAHALRDLRTQMQRSGVSPERINVCCYVLCTLLDEAASSTPWGGSGAWRQHSLLTEFAYDSFGGEQVFVAMTTLAKAPKENCDLLELIYAALTLGFEGRYRHEPGGAATLESIRARLAQIVRAERGDYPKTLAEHWRGVVPQPRSLLLGWLPLGVSAALAAVAAIGLFVVLSLRLGVQSDPVYARILDLRLTAPSVQAPAAAAPPAAPRLARLLAPHIQSGALAVRDSVDRSIVTMAGDALFAPGSATLAAARRALVQRIAEALNEVGDGPVLVTGHTDSQPIRTARFPSNWHLSQERADSVRTMLIGFGVSALRVRAEGRADGEPVASNDDSDHRALNRRVEITLYTPAERVGK